MAQAKEGDTVRIHYTGRLKDGKVFDSSVDREPLEFTIGEGKIIPGVEQGVIGMAPGESKTVNVLPDQAYGPHRPELVATIEKNEFPENVILQEGKILQFSQPTGQIFRARIVKVTDVDVTLDANHPLAGEDLIFEIELVEIVGSKS